MSKSMSATAPGDGSVPYDRTMLACELAMLVVRRLRRERSTAVGAPGLDGRARCETKTGARPSQRRP
jgi:hypothetical protein